MLAHSRQCGSLDVFLVEADLRTPAYRWAVVQVVEATPAIVAAIEAAAGWADLPPACVVIAYRTRVEARAIFDEEIGDA